MYCLFHSVLQVSCIREEPAKLAGTSVVAPLSPAEATEGLLLCPTFTLPPTTFSDVGAENATFLDATVTTLGVNPYEYNGDIVARFVCVCFACLLRVFLKAVHV